MIRFTKPCEGWKPGETASFDPGVEDAFVNWREVAEYVDELHEAEKEAKVKTVDAPPKDKMMRTPPKKK